VQEHNRARGPEVRKPNELQLADQDAETRDQRGGAYRPQGGPTAQRAPDGRNAAITLRRSAARDFMERR